METKPVIAVTTDAKLIDGYRWFATIDTYLTALTGPAGCLPLMVPSLGDAIDRVSLLDRVDGLLVTGSRSNVYPSIYGSDRFEETEPHDHDRDATTLPLIRDAISRGIPVLAICRGHQELNVALGGTLASEIQTFPGREDHRSPVSDSADERFAIRQSVTLTERGTLATILDGQSEGMNIEINSLHRQAIDRLGNGLVVEAKARDGTIEAVSMPNAPGFVLGIQWHPEFWASRGKDDVSLAILQAFGDEARRYADGNALDTQQLRQQFG